MVTEQHNIFVPVHYNSLLSVIFIHRVETQQTELYIHKIRNNIKEKDIHIGPQSSSGQVLTYDINITVIIIQKNFRST